MLIVNLLYFLDNQWICSNMIVLQEKDMLGSDMANRRSTTYTECCSFCLSTPGCSGFVWGWPNNTYPLHQSRCYLKNGLTLKTHSQDGRTELISIRIEDAHALSFMIEKPSNFNFHVGEYINICLTCIVRNEWHPFTICSSPE
ncbi:unnamed protein product [Adineta steineri]|uniref:Apple domain-containing protein n=1 Tax=Adineta steineri TaxID=433720 RepID=A0A819AQ86_9BILA|nr:unnamed protein product [Adineta steineri]CAF3785686.1 unnamed protein product [Adineta steineri]